MNVIFGLIPAEECSSFFQQQLRTAFFCFFWMPLLEWTFTLKLGGSHLFFVPFCPDGRHHVQQAKILIFTGFWCLMSFQLYSRGMMTRDVYWVVQPSHCHHCRVILCLWCVFCWVFFNTGKGQISSPPNLKRSPARKDDLDGGEEMMNLPKVRSKSSCQAVSQSY